MTRDKIINSLMRLETSDWVQFATSALEGLNKQHRKYEDLKEALVGDSDNFTHDELIEKIHHLVDFESKMENLITNIKRSKA
tara:strand:- start:3991 stop:4236 length:246 start_codon:yes stop_codon:yes gene_type:complete